MTKQIMTLEILNSGLARIKDMPKQVKTDPRLDSPLISLDHPLGWESVVTLLILEKGCNFAGAAKKLKEAWPEALAALNANRDGKNAKTEICTEAALRRRVLEVALHRYKQAKAKLKGKLTPEERVEQTRILEEVKKLFEFLRLELPADGSPTVPSGEEKNGEVDVQAVTDAGNAAKATVAAQTIPGAGQGVPPTPVGVQPKASTAADTDDLAAAAEKMMESSGAASKPEPGRGGEMHDASSQQAKEAGKSQEAPAMVEKQRQKKVKEAEIPLVDPVRMKDEAKIPPKGDGGKGGNEFPCPLCGGKMRMKTAGQGKNKGHTFYGCESWPETKCRGTRDPKGQDTTQRN